MVTFGGTAIFGYVRSMRPGQINPRDAQKNAFPAVNGTEELDQGSRGGFTDCEGYLYGDTAYALVAAKAMFESYNDGRAYVLVDQLSVAWPFVKLESFQVTGKIRQRSTGGLEWDYSARFRHLLI